MAYAFSGTGRTAKTVISDNLKCPICLEVYRRPKGLACMHTFCEKCIHSVIVKNAQQWVGNKEIQCPVCRKTTPSPSPKQAPTEWAKALPLNYAIIPLLETMAELERGLRQREAPKRPAKSLSLTASRLPITQYRIEQITVVDLHKKAGRLHSHYSGIAGLPCGRLAATDSSNDVFAILDDTFSVSDKVKLPSQPTDLAVIGDTSEVAVALPYRKMLQCVDTSTSPPILTRAFVCIRTPRTVATVSNTELAVGWEDGFGIIDLTGQEILFLGSDTAGRQIKFCSFNDCMTVDVSRSRVYQACSTAVHAFGFTGEPHFTYKNDHMWLHCGVALDRDMNLYICSQLTSTIDQVSHDGALIRVIDTGLTGPCTVGFSSNGRKMYVANVELYQNYFSRLQSTKGVVIKFK